MGPDRGSAATSPPTVVTESDAVAAGHVRYWDLEAFTPWTTYQDGSGAWHQTYWGDADSLGHKARLAASGHLRGTGIWVLGMDGNDRAMTQALSRNARPHSEVLGPPPTSKP